MGISRGMRKFTLGPPFRKKKENNSQANSLIWLPLVIESTLSRVYSDEALVFFVQLRGETPEKPPNNSSKRTNKRQQQQQKFPPKKQQPVTERAMSKKERKTEKKGWHYSFPA